MLYSLRPKFVAWLVLASHAPRQLFFTFWCGMFFGGLIMLIDNRTTGMLFTHDTPLAVPFIGCGLAAFLILPIVHLVGRTRNYARTEYAVFRDRLEVAEGYFTVRKKTVRFSDILEVTLEKNLLQRKAGVGSIHVVTRPDPDSFMNRWGIRPKGGNMIIGDNRPQNGILIRDIADPDAEYERLQTTIAKSYRDEEAKHDRPAARPSVPSAGSVPRS